MASEPDPIAPIAAVWINRWLSYGGSLIVEPHCDSVQVGMALDAKPHDQPRTELQRQWHDGWTVGRWRELHDLLSAMPGLREAVIHHVALHGHRYGDGTTTMYGEARG